MNDNYTPLPADLPENWSPGQIVSPDGISVGLTAQHGYNALNKYVNDAQKALNALRNYLISGGFVATKDIQDGAITMDKLSAEVVQELTSDVSTFQKLISGRFV